MPRKSTRHRPTEVSWKAMNDRCYRHTTNKYENYGGRGILVCERWRLSFNDFVQDMGERPSGTTLDRINGSGNYEPGNCRWATAAEQANNRRGLRMISHGGETMTISAWARRSGVPSRTLWNRLDRGWSESEAVTTPSLGRASANRPPPANARVLIVDGVAKAISVWARESGIRANTIAARLARGWTETDAVRATVDTRRVRKDRLTNATHGI